MDTDELFICCQEGILHRLRYLVEEKDVDLNSTDLNSMTPLYNACTNNHQQVVKYLLENGARLDPLVEQFCNSNVFSEEITQQLLDFEDTSIKEDQFSKFFKRVLEDTDFSDMEFIVKNESFKVHKLILATRSEHFYKLFTDTWKCTNKIDLSKINLSMKTLKSLVEYLYVGHTIIKTNDVSPFLKAVRRFNLKRSLQTEIRNASDYEMDVLYFQPKQLLQDDFLKLFLSALPKKLQPKGRIEKPIFVDLHIVVGKHRFLCHKVLVCGRCSYLRALCTDHFSESYYSQTRKFQRIELHNTDPVLFVKVLQYIYTDTCDLTPENASDVLCLADIFILPGLKRLCASKLIEHLSTDNVIPTIRFARQYNMCRLEEQCTKYICEHVEVLDLPDFKRLVSEDKDESREEGSIQVLDNIGMYFNKLRREIDITFFKLNEIYEAAIGD